MVETAVPAVGAGLHGSDNLRTLLLSVIQHSLIFHSDSFEGGGGGIQMNL